MTPRPFRLRDGAWADLGPLAGPLRRTVFVGEQSVPEALEWDGRDPECHHIIAELTDGRCIGTARLTPDHHLGRMAVARDWRRQGAGRAILAHALELVRARGGHEVVLAAQLTAAPFYERMGFTAYGAVFEDAGIDHRMMRRPLA